MILSTADFNQRLRQVIGDATIDEFAASLEESAQRVKDILRGKQRPPSDFLTKLHVQLGVDLNWLLAGDGAKAASMVTVKEQLLLAHYRAASDEGRKAIEQTSHALAKRPDTGGGKKP
jgi:transcriptional regulator with XRE-family HTH domain